MHNLTSRGYRDNYYNYMTKHIFNIKSEDRQSELLVLSETKKILRRVKDGLMDENNTLQKSKHINYINMFIDVTGVSITNPTGDINWSIINHGYDRRNSSISDRYINEKDGHIRFPQIPTAKSLHGLLKDNVRYHNLNIQLTGLARTIRMCIRDCINDNALNEIIMKHESITIQKYIENIVPIIIEKNQVYADLTVKHSLASRLSDTSNVRNEQIGNVRASLVRKYRRANTKLLKEIWASVLEEVDNLKIDDMLDEAVKKAFHCDVEDKDKDIDVRYLYNKGHYFDFMGIHTLNDKKLHEEKMKINKWPTSLEKLIKLYEYGKKEAYLLFLEAEEISLNYKKRKVIESYGYNINSTKQNSTQVPLSFETVS